jgi:gamma-tubulin complex component 5
MQDTFSQSFDVFLDILQKVTSSALPTQEAPSFPRDFSRSIARIPPAVVTASLLDNLIQAAQDQLWMGDTVTSNVLMRVFARSAEPVWAMVGRWLRDGMPVGDPSGRCETYGNNCLDDEFFVEDNEMLLIDPDFWREGYSLRNGTEDGNGLKAVPAFLAHVARHILGSGKAVGLVRALGVPFSFDEDDTWLSDWRPFTVILAREQNYSAISDSQRNAPFCVSTETLSQVVYDALLPYCQSTGARLAKALIEDFEVWQHLSTMEDLYLMKRGDAMSHFADILFAKVCAFAVQNLSCFV